jgi:hypothetical protein
MGARNRVRKGLLYRLPGYMGWRNDSFESISGLLKSLKIWTQASFWFCSGVERLYCKRPIQCLASPKILIPHSLTARRVCPPPAFGAGGGHTRWVERGWGVNILEDARHCSVLYIRNYFVSKSKKVSVFV